jgi:electron transfer flavoprotein beta subunit
MKIVVAIKPIAELDDEFELRNDELDVDPDFIDWRLNEWDSFSVETAVRIREDASEASAADDELVIVSVTGEHGEDAIRTCLAMGADRAIRVWEDGLPELDPLAMGRVLAAAIEREKPDLVLCGAQSSDSVHGATGVALAGFLHLPHIAVVKALDYDRGAQVATIGRELEGGVIELMRVRCPALLTIQSGINTPRYATLRAIKQADAKPLEELALVDLGLDLEAVNTAAGATVRRMAVPQPGGRAQMLDGSAAEVAGRIAELIRASV